VGCQAVLPRLRAGGAATGRLAHISVPRKQGGDQRRRINQLSGSHYRSSNSRAKKFAFMEHKTATRQRVSGG
jgi:hypothetical protein